MLAGERVGTVRVAEHEARAAAGRDVERGTGQLLDAPGGHDDRERLLLVDGVRLIGLGDRVEREVVGVLDAAGAGDLDPQRERRWVVLGFAQLEDPGDRLRRDGEHDDIGSGGGGIGHGIRLTSGAVTDTTPENEGHGPEVLYEVADHVATITLNRPHRRNAISVRMLQLLSELFAKADDDGDVRVVLLTGAGKGFCSGLDIKDAMSGSGIGGTGGGGGGGGGSFMQTRNLPTVILQEMDTPVIAVINGAAAGYGLDLALGCDMRLMASSASLLPGFAKRGVVPESGGTWYLPRLLGWAKAAEISYLGRDLDAA